MSIELYSYYYHLDIKNLNKHVKQLMLDSSNKKYSALTMPPGEQC